MSCAWLFSLSPPDADGKTSWTTLRQEAGAGAVAAGRRQHLRLRERGGEAAHKRAAGGAAEAVTLMVAGCSFQRRATLPAAASPAAILGTSPTPARTGDSYLSGRHLLSWRNALNHFQVGRIHAHPACSGGNVAWKQVNKMRCTTTSTVVRVHRHICMVAWKESETWTSRGRRELFQVFPICEHYWPLLAALFAWLISQQPAVLFSPNKPATSTFLSEQTSTSHQPPANRTSWASRPIVSLGSRSIYEDQTPYMSTATITCWGGGGSKWKK
jgi:hypothetical protein